MRSELISAEIPPTAVPRSSNAFSIRFFQSIFFIIPVIQLNICSPRLIQSIFVIKFLKKLKIPFIILPTNVEKFISIPSTSILFTNSASLLPLLLKLIVCSNSVAVLKTPLIPSENVVAILLKSPDWAERLKEAIKSGNWYGVGEVLAERINAIFDSIDWENTEKKLLTE